MELPVVFLHGIGVGLYPYMKCLEDVNHGRQKEDVNHGRQKEDGKVGILAVEILPVSSRITWAMLGKEELC